MRSGSCGKVILRDGGGRAMLHEAVRDRVRGGGSRRSGPRASRRTSGSSRRPQGVRITGGGHARCSTSAPTTTSGSPSHPRVIAAAQGSARPLGLRHGLRALHLRHAGRARRARAPDVGVPRHRGHHPLLLVLRRERRRLRAAAGRGLRHHHRPAQPRLDHRRGPAVQGAAPHLRARRHGRPRGEAREAEGAAVRIDRHRRRVLHGRRHREARRRSATSPNGTARS